MMSLYAGPRRKNKIAGVLGYSGALIGAEGLTAPSIQKIPVRLIHGDVDTVVPLAAYHMAYDSLSKNGFTVTGGITRGLGHSIDEDGIEAGAAFLSGVLS
jgi:phospholipase/carboxylesterase